MSTITSAYEAVMAQATTKTQNTAKTKDTSKVNGKTIGNPTLSDKASEYYEELKKKYSDMDFVLVSEDKKEQAQSIAGTFKNSGKTLVLINEDKIEQMATDENYRKKYEDIIGNAAKQIPELEKSLGASQADVKNFGIQVNDNGTVSFFATVGKSLESQKTRIAKQAQEKRAEKKASEKRAAKQEQEERLREHTTENAEGAQKTNGTEEDTVTFTASSIEELMKKLNDFSFANRSDSVQTESEKLLGQHIDFKG